MRRYYVYQSPEDQICPHSHAEKAAQILRAKGAKVELATHERGHGWRGPVYPNIRKGIEWLEAHR